MNKGELAKSYFENGYNCAQALVLAFKDEVNIDEKTLLKLASGFGGGMGRLRLTCGVFSAMNIILSLKFGYDSNDTSELKTKHYQKIQELATLFEKENGSLICANLLNLKEIKRDYHPSVRNESFYQKRPCGNIIYNGAVILEKYLKDLETNK